MANNENANTEDTKATSTKTLEAPGVSGLSEDQRVQLRQRLHDLARGIGGPLPIRAEDAESAPHPSHWNFWS